MGKQGAKVLTGPFTLKITPHEEGMAISIDPHLDKPELAELLIGVVDSVMTDTHMAAGTANLCDRAEPRWQATGIGQRYAGAAW